MTNIEFSPESFYILGSNGNYERIAKLSREAIITLFGFRNVIL